MVGLAGPSIRGEGMIQFDDMGLDEYDVADERQHEIGFDRYEINIDDMTYEELLNLQARIGYVNKGLNLDDIKSFPQMTKAELKKFIKKGTVSSKPEWQDQRGGQIEEEKKECNEQHRRLSAQSRPGTRNDIHNQSL